MDRKMYTNEVKHAVVDAIAASNLLDVVHGAAEQIEEGNYALAVSIYRFFDSGAWYVIDKYSGRADGFVQAISDAVFNPQRVNESDEDYKKRWQSKRSWCYEQKRTGWLISTLRDNEWGGDWGDKPKSYHLNIIGQLIEAPEMKGDVELICSTASNLLERVQSGELYSQPALRAEVKRMLGKAVPQSDNQPRTITVKMRVTGIDDEAADTIQKMIDAYAMSLVMLKGGKKA